MKKSLLLSALLLSFSLTALSQSTPVWQAFYQATGDNSDRFNKIVPDGSGNLVAVGYTIRPNNYRDFLTVKYQTNGDTMWVRTKNGSNSEDDEATCVAVDANGNIIVVGYADYGSTQDDIMIVKYDPLGVQLWDTSWSSPFKMDDFPVDVKIDGNNNIIIGGNAEPDSVMGNNDIFVIKLDPNGALLWENLFSRSGVIAGKDELGGIVVNSSNDIFITGRSSNGTDDDIITRAYNGADGSQLWIQFYNSGNGDDRGRAITLDNSGNVIVAGRNDNGNDDDFRVIKYNNSGILQWTKSYNAPANEDDDALLVKTDASGNVYVAGETDSNSGILEDLDFALVKYDGASGTFQWARIIDSPTNAQQADVPSDMIIDNSGNIIITGKSDQDPGVLTNNDFMTVMYNSSGQVVWSELLAGSRPNGSDIASSLCLVGSNIFVAGGSENNTTQKDARIVSYDAMGNDVWIRDFNGEGDFSESARQVLIDANDNSFSAGYLFQENENRDALMVKTDAAGNILCNYQYRGNNAGDDEFFSMAMGPNGFIYAAGVARQIDQKSNFLLVKIDPATCDSVWTRTYDFVRQSDRAESVVIDAAGNVYVTGRSDSNPLDSADNFDIVTIKYDTNGNQQWLMRYNGSGNLRDEPSKILIDQNGDILVCGRAENVHDDDFIVIKYNAATGAEVWGTPFLYNGPFSNDDRALDMTVDGSNNIFVCGYSQTGSAGSNEDPVVLKVDANGNNQGFYTYASIGFDQAVKIANDQSGNVFVLFETDIDPDPLISNYDVRLMKFDNNLNSLWNNPPQYDSPIHEDDRPSALIVTAAGNAFLAASTEHDIVAGKINQNWLILGYDPNGSQIFSAIQDGPSATDDSPNGLAIRGAALWGCGNLENTGNNGKDFVVQKYDINVNISENEINYHSEVFPNPFSSMAELVLDKAISGDVSVSVYDVAGRIVMERTYAMGERIFISSDDLGAGMYHYKANVDGVQKTEGKFIIQ